LLLLLLSLRTCQIVPEGVEGGVSRELRSLDLSYLLLIKRVAEYAWLVAVDQVREADLPGRSCWDAKMLTC